MKAVLSEAGRQQAIGLTVGVIRHAAIAWLGGCGYADRDRGLPVTPQTLFRWASVSKPMTAVAAMQLVEQGRLDLDADVRRYVPEFPAPCVDGRCVVVTPRGLLCHVAGLPHYDTPDLVWRDPDGDDPDPIAALPAFWGSPLVHVPFAGYGYSSFGYVLLGAVVERAGGAPLMQQVYERIASPLGMTTLRVDRLCESLPDRSAGYRLDGDVVIPSVEEPVAWKLAAAGFFSNIEDLARFAVGLLQRRLVSPETERLMWTPVYAGDGCGGDALGFAVTGAGAFRAVWHNGGTDKGVARLLVYPDHPDRLGVVVLSNCEWVDVEAVTAAVLDALPVTLPVALAGP